MRLMSDYREKAKNTLNNKEYKAINHPQGLMKRITNKKKKVTVVTAAYNADKFIDRTIESVLNQSLGMDFIEYIIIDDKSTDGTSEIVKSYAAKNKNISLIALNENTGSPGTPRNIGIELATSDYITFLDADDWLHPEGLETLYSILEETNDDYVVGKTIKVEKSGESIIGEFASVKERRNISPFDIPHFFYHMGPTARMMKRSILIDHGIRFPEMKFGEDKVFFCDLFFTTRSVSTTTKPIYYVNRMEENNGSLTRTTDVLDKRTNDLEIIKYIKSKELPVEMEKTALTRLYEYDFVRTFNSNTFVNANNKESFIDLFKEVMETTKDLRYSFLDEFKTPIYKAAAELFLDDRLDDFIKLFEWLRREKNKGYVIKGDLPFYEIPFLEDDYRYIRIPMLAIAQKNKVEENREYIQSFNIFGDYVHNLNSIIIRDRKRVGNDLECTFEVENHHGWFKACNLELDQLENSLYTVFIRYNEYELMNIKSIPENQIKHNGREFEFYSTKAHNIGLAVKPAK
ncbi:glycosyltransferase family 2 protein [Rossellomorea aquimaris]|jgi:glycosyltransferase involved in cell wall biosynthesis|nr:glycosyltransferase family 2 protein [Rossellomorea aquimaris]WRP06368.1 glycosyltransferase family 2 protein [Rossellomorea aquimaris]